MASDVFADDFANDKHDLNGDIFMSSGIMSPKELYLMDLPQCKDVLTDHTQYKGASSSDSGISTIDDFQDVANVTDLNSILTTNVGPSNCWMDTDFKDFDFSLDFVVPKSEQDDLFDSGFLLKSEPGSPYSCSRLQVSPDFFFPNDVTIKEEGSPQTQPVYHQCDSLSPPSPSYSPEQNYTIEPLYTPSSPSQIHSSSPRLSLSSQIFQVGHSNSSYPTTFPYIHHQKSLLQHSSNLPDTPSSTYSADSPHHASPSPPSTPNFIVVPCVKKETQISILSPPGGLLVQASGDIKPIIPTAFNIDAILNSKVKIKPKPGSELVISKAGSTQWVNTTTSNHLPFSSQQTFPIITSSVISAGGISSIAEEKSFKRAQRIIKNRESASLSRKRKKEYLTSLEERLQQCRDENDRLLKENDTLRQQVEYLQRENSGLKHINMSPPKKMCLMCLVFLLVLNLSPFSFLNGPGSINPQQGMGPSYHPAGRHLMSLPDDGTDTLSEYGSGIRISKDMWALMQFNEELSRLIEKLNISEKLGNMCPMYFNSTESNRLAEQLRGWMISQEEEKKKKERKQQRKKKKYPPVKQYGTYSFNAQTQSAPSAEVGGPALSGNNYPVQVFSGGYYSRQQLLSAIPRRNDTFYVLSFSTDYFLVPATAHNKTMRPRMSLLMPVVTPSVNDSTVHAHDSIGVMQIDCEILNTNLIHLYRTAFSEETLNNSTFFESSESNHNSSNTTRGNGEDIHQQRNKNNSTSKKSDQNVNYWKKLRNITSD